MLLPTCMCAVRACDSEHQCSSLQLQLDQTAAVERQQSGVASTTTALRLVRLRIEYDVVGQAFVGCVECMKYRLLLPVIAVSVRQSVSLSAT